MNGVGVDYTSTVASTLHDWGHEVEVLQFAGTSSLEYLPVTTVRVSRTLDMNFGWTLTANGRWTFNWLLYHHWQWRVRRYLDNHDVDIVVSDRICSTPGTLAAADRNVPAVILTTGPAAVRYVSSDDSLDKTPEFRRFPRSKQLQYPFIRRVHRLNESGFAAADEIVALSEFDASITEHTFGRSPTIVRLPVRLEEFVPDDWHPEALTMLNPRHKKKGLDIVLALADRHEDIPFQVAGSLYDGADETALRERENVTYLGWVDEMRDVYRNTKLLLIPSRYQEGGPRIIAEAFANGIPVVGSDLGGIPDYVGNAGALVGEYEDVSAWEAAVRPLLDDGDRYEKVSRRARERSQLFDLNDRVREFESVLERVVQAEKSG